MDNSDIKIRQLPIVTDVLNPWDYSIIRDFNLPLCYTYHEVLEQIDKFATPEILEKFDRVIVICRNFYTHVVYFSTVFKLSSAIPFNPKK